VSRPTDERARGEKLAALIDQTPELAFVAHRTRGTVHVILPDGPRWSRTGGPAMNSLPQNELAAVVTRMLVGATRTLCGFTARTHLGGFEQGDKPVATFADERLCASCHRVLGERSHRAFEHPRPGGGPGADTPQ